MQNVLDRNYKSQILIRSQMNEKRVKARRERKRSVAEMLLVDQFQFSLSFPDRAGALRE